jgi:uncharacterized membrane protein
MPDVASVVDRNIAALVARRRQYERARTWTERMADAIGGFAGSLASVYVHLAYFGTWVIINLGWTPLKPFDPSFVVLAMVASVEAIFLSTFVLMMQNRLANLAEQRAELDLQISLLSEHEITRLLQIVAAIGEKLSVAVADPEFEQLKQDVAPEQVLERMDAAQSEPPPSNP